MKKYLSLFLSFSLLFTIAACSREEPLSELEAIQKQLAEMEGYTCTATLTRTNDRGEQTYETKQYCKSTGEYRLELTAPENVAGNYTVFDGERICQYNPRLDSSIIRDIPESQHRNELFLSQFIQNYMQSEGVSVETAALDESRCIVLEAIIPGNDAALASEKLWVDRESLLPVRFVIYDAEGEERYSMDYSSFEFDPQFDDTLFTIEE
ncbi:MAG: outer membrane lipoprotein carrier protein LolA [Anaerotignum sp.]|nr:outer membrane lipoprotein carrier protein LolA [Anaerotignum sp.]MBP3307150.1 outer membrane lipoprotein carrier protein LolA [Anaerotignum sp.]